MILEEQLHEIRQKSKEYAKYKSERIRLDNFRKVIRARLMSEALKNGHTSVAAQEREAMGSEEYGEVCEAIAIATEQETSLYWELHMFDLEVEIWRTQQANERAEMNKY